MDDQHVREIFNASPFGFAHHEIVLDERNIPVDYRFIEVNPTFETITGLTAEHVVGKTVREVIPGIETAAFDWIGFYGTVALNGGNESFEQYFELLQKWYRVHVYSGQKGFFTTTFVDITAEKITQTAIQSSISGVAFADSQGKVFYVNDAFLQMFGYETPDECFGKTPFEAHPEAEFGKVNHAMEQIAAHGAFKGELKAKKKSGELFDVQFSASTVNDERGEQLYVMTSFEDITERKQAEEELKRASEMQSLLMKVASDYINIPKEHIDESINVSLKELGEFVSADRAYIFEYDWAGNVTNNTFEWCNDGIDPQIDHLQSNPIDLLPDWITAHKNGETVYIYDLTQLPPDDSVRQILEPQGIKSVLALPLMNAGTCSGFVGFDYVTTTHAYSENEKNLLQIFAEMLVNVSNRIELEKDLVQSKEQAEAASKAKSEFVANMSHEIRTPLNGVIGFTDLLRNTQLTPVQQQYVDSANVSGHTLLGIINDILDFSKIEAGTLELESVTTDMIQLLENSVDIVKLTAAENDLELLLDIDLRMPRFADVDPVRLKQILANLLGNAVKFTARGEVELKTVYENLAGSRGKLSFSVRDTGIGISAAQKEKLFKAFSQADGSTTRKFGGTGLGLVISDMIAKKMGSKINMKSTPDEGSTFYFDLVTQFEEGEKRDPTQISSVHRCLIVDDNANNCSILRNMLSLWNIESESSSSSHEALERLETSADFDLVICDYNMPGMDGLETIRMIRENLGTTSKKQPVILLHSSSENAEIHRKCEEMGVRFRLTKPVKSDDLFTYLCDLQGPERVSVTPDNGPDKTGPENTNVGERVRILVAEDNRVNMKLIKIIIRKMLPESEIYEAATGLQAIEQYKTATPDIVFMDVQMPELNGLDATTRIRALEVETGAHVPIIALTAGALKEEREKCYAAGMDDFITKPIDQKKIKLVFETLRSPL